MKRFPLLALALAVILPLGAAEKPNQAEAQQTTPVELQTARQKLADARQRLAQLNAERAAALAKAAESRSAREKQLVESEALTPARLDRSGPLPQDPIRADGAESKK